uniref:Putative secreted protein n=1 Tax=Anopheles darlingi TaxID=43151 RepID=A0A2M4DMA6_ANODA
MVPRTSGNDWLPSTLVFALPVFSISESCPDGSTCNTPPVAPAIVALRSRLFSSTLREFADRSRFSSAR